jgi:hypothetical protein
VREPGRASHADLDHPNVLPTFLLIGAQKAATTSLIASLGAHPEVFTLPGEVHFFDRHLARGTEWYAACFRGAGPARAVGESTPEYMYLEEVPPALAGHLPQARLIAILRNPVDRAYSHYWHNRTRGWEPLGFDEAIEAEADRLAGATGPRRGRFAYLRRGRYLEQLLRVTDHFPRRALAVVLFEDFRDRPMETLRTLYSFLGVDPALAPPTRPAVKNRFMTFRSMRMRSRIRRLPAPLRRVASRMNVRYTDYPPMSERTRGMLVERFEEENRALESWLGRELSGWRA